MAAKGNYISCLRALRQQAVQSRRATQTQNTLPDLIRPIRHFSTTIRPLAVSTSTTSAPPDSNKVRQVAPIVSTSDPEFLPCNDKTTPPAPTTGQKIVQETRKLAPAITETYVAYGVCETLVKECARQADYTIPQREKGEETPMTKDGEDLGVGKGWWYEELHLTPTFNTWAQITFLHMYLLTVRIRCFPPNDAPIWHQHLIDHFSYLAEDRMITLHNIAARVSRNKYLKDLFVQWRGLQAAYDEGLVKGDAVLAAAVWRNVCKGDENVDLVKLGMVVSYMRSVLKQLDGMDGEGVAMGDVLFGDPAGEVEVVRVRSRMMDRDPELGVQKEGSTAPIPQARVQAA